MMKISKPITFVLFLLVLSLATLTACSNTNTAADTTSNASANPTEIAIDSTEGSITEGDADVNEPVTILIAAAASLEYSYTDELIPMFQEKYPWITVEGTFDSSGKLQTQIEEGLEADVFMSAAMKQMNALKDEGLIWEDSIIELLENKIVLIVPEGSEAGLTSFEELANADTIALGDPESVPAGQYAQEALTSLGIWEEVSAKASLGTNVTQVLNWVAEGVADAGIVYATDAATTQKVTVVADAPEGSLAQKVIYPVGIVSATAHPNEAALFVEFLASPEAIQVFETYGFSSNQ